MRNPVPWRRSEELDFLGFLGCTSQAFPRDSEWVYPKTRVLLEGRFRLGGTRAAGIRRLSVHGSTARPAAQITWEKYGRKLNAMSLIDAG